MTRGIGQKAAAKFLFKHLRPKLGQLLGEKLSTDTSYVVGCDFELFPTNAFMPLIGKARVYVAIDSEPLRIAGYFCLSAGSVDYAGAPIRVGKGLARHPIPVVLIGRLGVDLRYHGQGLARFLVRAAFQRTINVADAIGVRAIVVRAKDDALSAFYEKLGFESCVTDPRLLSITIKDVKKSLSVAARAPKS